VHVALDREDVGQALRVEPESMITEPRSGTSLDGLRRDPQLLVGVDDVARGEHRLVVDPLDGTAPPCTRRRSLRCCMSDRSRRIVSVVTP
jgi:hypothetical protein